MMKRMRLFTLLLPLLIAATPAPGLKEWAEAVRTGLQQAARAAESGNVDSARAHVLRVYLDYYEVIEGWYGPGGKYAHDAYEKQIATAEAGFHVLLRASSAQEFQRGALQLDRSVEQITAAILTAGVPLQPSGNASAEVAPATQRELTTTELAPWNDDLTKARLSLDAGDFDAVLSTVERLYLEGFEPLEARLPSEIVNEIERTIHLRLRPALKSGAADASPALAALGAQLTEADDFLKHGGSFWFGAFNSLVIIVREGLEAVLLIGALLAYLTATRANVSVRRRIWLGAGAGIAASVITWIVAVTLLPMSGASRELMEGVTALVAVAVLLYVSHWLFQKTYIHDWKEYLREHLGTAVSSGSAFAMMGLAFAAVYREGFETVLFYQALALDVGGKSVLTGFVPGLLLISGVGWAIIRAGVKLPLKRVFAVTNSILLYLAFVFLGKGIFNLQESGAFAAHPIGWLPSHPALQQVFGFYPLIETIAAQAALALLLLLAVVFYRVKMAKAKAPAQKQAPAMAA